MPEYNELLEPISWETFLRLPDGEQEAYLRQIISRFHVATARIAQDLFGVSQNTLHRYVEKKHMAIPKSAGGRMPEQTLLTWRAWVSGRGAEKTSAFSLVAGGEDDISGAVGGIVKDLQSSFGNVRVTITIEPV